MAKITHRVKTYSGNMMPPENNRLPTTQTGMVACSIDPVWSPRPRATSAQSASAMDAVKPSQPK
ncbi:hypothetical protein DEJ35_03720 [Curtobacterium sp. MCPF17_051]|nr:hypothetical protein DEJ35_03720 [Curtobacterium sp. MCPF17_051]